MRKNTLSKVVLFTFATLIFGLFQNCNNNYKVTTADAPAISSIQSASAAMTVSASHANPPLDLFFIVDNSASMLGNQVNLGAQFANVFQSNNSSLANFDVNVYLFSTASTVNTNFISEIPTMSLGSVTSIPAVSDPTNLVKIPGSIYAYQNVATGTYGTAPYSVQFNPMSVLATDTTVNAITPYLHVPKKGAAESASAYASRISTLTTQFQNRLAYLNPTSELAYEHVTDISSGLCSIARILKHSSNFISAGDSAAFIVVSDDNDRLNDRNTYGNQCIESIIGSNEIVDGTCGHDATTFSYNSSAIVTYQTDTIFKYQSGTSIPYSYTSGESCVIGYQNGYKYTSTYTAIQTQVTYTKCTQSGDGTCLATQAGATQTIAGSYVGTGTTCSQDMTSLVSSPAPDTTFSCASANASNQTGASGTDTASNGSVCSTAVVNALAGTNKTAITCTIGAASTTSATIAGQAVGSCASYCSSHASTYPNCSLTSTTASKTNGSLAFNIDGVTCASSCPVAATCGTDTINNYLIGTYGNTATCGTPTASLASIKVNLGATSAGAALTCASPLAGLTVTNSSGGTICAGQSTVQSCVTSLITGTPITGCTVNGGDTATATVATNVGCSTSCSNSAGLCDPSLFATVSAYYASRGYKCNSSANGGAKTLVAQFNNSVAPTANCSSKCSDMLSGSCDGHGYGATDGSTVSTYIQSQLGGATTCASTMAYAADTPSLAIDASNVANACNSTPNSPIFKASDSAHPSNVATNYVAGTSAHLVGDFKSYILSQAASVFGANNVPAVAVITKLSGDHLNGTDVGTDYQGLASTLGSAQVSSVLGSYSTSLSNISNFIVHSTMNNFILPLPANATVYSVSVIHGSAAPVALASSAWSVSGSTLSVAQSANLQIGDQIIYDYNFSN
jgi:hypothetical protein